VSGLGVHRKLGRDISRTLTPTDHRDIPHHMMSCSALKSWGKQKEGEDVQSYGALMGV